MGTLWTPSGEHRPREEPEATPSPPPAGGAGGGVGAGAAEPPPGQPTEDELAAIREVHAQLAATPVEDVVANHLVGIFQLALIRLGLATPPGGEPPRPDLAGAGVAIDAFAAVVDALGARLGAHESELREALTQVQLAYAHVADALDAGAAGGGPGGDAGARGAGPGASR